MEKHHIIPVWFFVGVLLFIYGLLILANGLMAPTSVKLEDLAEVARPAVQSAPIWWGGVLTVFGAAYIWLFRPKK